METKNIGYGIVYKIPMKDRRLTIEAKAIYAYLCAYAGKDNQTYPTLKLILYDLKITQERFYKHLKLLIQYDYIKSKKIRLKTGTFYKTVYVINKDIKPLADFPQQDKPIMDNQLITINSKTINSITNSVFKGEKKEKGEKRKKSVFGDTLETFDFKGYERWYNSLTVEQRNEKRLNSPIVKLALLENANQK